MHAAAPLAPLPSYEARPPRPAESLEQGHAYDDAPRSRVALISAVLVVLVLLGIAAGVAFGLRSAPTTTASTGPSSSTAGGAPAPEPPATAISTSTSTSTTSTSTTTTTTVDESTTAPIEPPTVPPAGSLATVVSKGCSSTCKVYRRNSPTDDLAQKGEGYHIDGDVVLVVCVAAGQNVKDGDSGRESADWFKLDDGFYLSAVYLAVIDPAAVPAC